MLLKSLGLRFAAIPSEVDETSEGEPREVVLSNALAKGHAVAARRRPGGRVCGAGARLGIGRRDRRRRIQRDRPAGPAAAPARARARLLTRLDSRNLGI